MVLNFHGNHKAYWKRVDGGGGGGMEVVEVGDYVPVTTLSSSE